MLLSNIKGFSQGHKGRGPENFLGALPLHPHFHLSSPALDKVGPGQVNIKYKILKQCSFSPSKFNVFFSVLKLSLEKQFFLQYRASQKAANF